MEIFKGKIVYCDKNIVTVEFFDLEGRILADFERENITVTPQEELEEGTVVEISSEKPNKAIFKIIGGYWTKEEIAEIQEKAKVQWNEIKDFIK